MGIRSFEAGIRVGGGLDQGIADEHVQHHHLHTVIVVLVDVRGKTFQKERIVGSGKESDASVMPSVGGC